jgi:hypothetical protein
MAAALSGGRAFLRPPPSALSQEDPDLSTSAAARSNRFEVPKTMKAWVLGGPDELKLVEKPVPQPGRPRFWCASTRSRSAPPTSRS